MSVLTLEVSFVTASARYGTHNGDVNFTTDGACMLPSALKVSGEVVPVQLSWDIKQS